METKHQFSFRMDELRINFVIIWSIKLRVYTILTARDVKFCINFSLLKSSLLNGMLNSQLFYFCFHQLSCCRVLETADGGVCRLLLSVRLAADRREEASGQSETSPGCRLRSERLLQATLCRLIYTRTQFLENNSTSLRF